MGFNIVSIKMPTDFTYRDLRTAVRKRLKIGEFDCQIRQQSLDARNKSRIHWVLQVLVTSPEIEGAPPKAPAAMSIPRKKREGCVVIVGSGPAGIFAGLVLQRAGFRTLLLERGSEVGARDTAVREFEATGVFDSGDNYAFGEGGAGTFSDGKLTSRSKHISLEKRFILENYVQAGAPDEILYLAHPHLGTDNLMEITRRLRNTYQETGGEIMFNTLLEDLVLRGDRVREVVTTRGTLDVSDVIVGCGHSAYETYRMLMKNGVAFRTKNFALGSRIEHPQEVINMAQWGRSDLPGVKAAEYRLSTKPDDGLPVYTFCMCPGGTVVPAAAYKGTNIVNGMSRYQRGGRFANAACVAAVSMETLLGREADPLEALDWLETLEHSFFAEADGYRAPFSTIKDFLNDRISADSVPSSYPMGLLPAPLGALLPETVARSLKLGLADFCRKIRGFSDGVILGLESKTSSPVQVVREKTGLCNGFSNLSVVGEGSGWAGGIISSAADGIRAALALADE